MTAPLTPHDQQPPHPPLPSGDAGSANGRPETGREVRDGLIIALGVALLGVALGVLWWWAAPQVPLISDGTAVYLKDSEGEQAVGGDGWFTLMGLAFGALTAAAVFLWRRTGGAAVVIGLAVGALGASLIAWRLGIWLGPSQNVVAHAKAVGANKVFYAPLQLRAKAALLAWPIASMGVFLALTSAFGPREEEPPPHWDGWAASPQEAQEQPGATQPTQPAQPTDQKGPTTPPAPTDPPEPGKPSHGA